MRYFVLLFIVYEFVFYIYFQNLYTNNQQEYHARSVKLVKKSFQSTVDAYGMIYNDCYATQSDTISKLVHMANGASLEQRNKVRKILLKDFMSFFNYQKLNSLNGFHIFDKDGRSLLRFHQPKNYDDMIINKRYSLQKLNKEFIYQDGFEIGVFQESYRFQYPLFYDGEFVGSYEYSVDSQAIIDEMQSFYGDYNQFLMHANLLENMVSYNNIQKYYVKIKIGSRYFYLKKNMNIKKLDSKRLSYIKSLKEFQEALNKSDVKVIDYQYKTLYHAVVVLPVNDIQNKNFAYILVHINKTPILGFKHTFWLEMFLATLFGLMLFRYIYKELGNAKYIKELINLQTDLIVVCNSKYVEDANNAFLDFFDVRDVEFFQDKYGCISTVFLKSQDCIAGVQDGVDWITYIQQNPQKTHRVKMQNKQKEARVFSVDIQKILDTHKYLVLFRDITDELQIKKELEDRANFDTLTHIYNRNRFEYFLDKEIKKAKRYSTTFSLIMFDIDHFKDINDDYGHDVGDIVLKELSALVLNHTREVDIFARWGGEEFMIISQSNIYQSEMFAEKLRQIIQEHKFSHIDTLRCSFGVAQYREDDNIHKIVKRCDSMLYSAKESGRNCVASLK